MQYSHNFDDVAIYISIKNKMRFNFSVSIILSSLFKGLARNGISCNKFYFLDYQTIVAIGLTF